MKKRLMYIVGFVVTLLSCHQENKGGIEMIIEDPAELATITDVVKVRDTQHNNDDMSIKNEFKSIKKKKKKKKKKKGKKKKKIFKKGLYVFNALS